MLSELRLVALSVALLAPPALAPSGVRADADGLRIMTEPTGYTDVVDAFDEGDPFDFDVHVGYRRVAIESTIQREAATGGGRSSVEFADVGTSNQVIKQLNVGLDVGLFRDVMLTLQIPFVLSDERTIEWRRVTRSESDSFTRLFGSTTVFRSKSRFGVPGIDLGLRWGVTNQYRQRGWPTWVLLAQGHAAMGEVLAACAQGGDCDGGITAGVSSFELGSRWSHRSRYFEPYLGVSYTWPIVTTGKDLYSQNAGVDSARKPPQAGHLAIGMAIVPWEDRRRFQRFTVDLRGFADYRTAGREASPLFDVLGTSALLGDRENGLTDVEARLRAGVDLGLVMRAARYVRFRVHVALSRSTPYLVTTAPGCGGQVVVDSVDNSVGECGGEPFIPVIELPGSRFRIDGELTTDLRATATGHF